MNVHQISCAIRNAANQIKKRMAGGMQASNWKWHLDEVFVKIRGKGITYGA
jgi:transposase-like protein